jgi:hypothetical protein
MSKKKKRNRAPQSLTGDASAAIPGNLPPTLLDEVLSCENGSMLAKEHLARRPEILFFAASAAFQAFSTEDLMGDGFEIPNDAVLDYLEFAARALGMSEVAKLVKQNFPASLLMFEETVQSLDGEALSRSISNAKGMGFLLA